MKSIGLRWTLRFPLCGCGLGAYSSAFALLVLPACSGGVSLLSRLGALRLAGRGRSGRG